MSAQAPEIASLPDATTALTTLVVDDSPDMRLLARSVLERAGIKVVAEAADGSAAVHLFRQLSPPPIPTVILLDNMMPNMTGVEAARQILTELPGQLIVLFSAYLNDDVIAQARQLGVVACVPKLNVGMLPEIIRGIATAGTGVG